MIGSGALSFIHTGKGVIFRLCQRLGNACETDIENRLLVAKGEREGEGWMDWEFSISRYKLLYIEWINKVLL